MVHRDTQGRVGLARGQAALERGLRRLGARLGGTNIRPARNRVGLLRLAQRLGRRAGRPGRFVDLQAGGAEAGQARQGDARALAVCFGGFEVQPRTGGLDFGP
jgi:hypothetical protein